ncbi:MAG: 50S ribosomal protein L4, partial [Planctomycetes bacterium]|nr:50S ribosomal protein L4 [Planctomycetota bacterium]
FAKQTRSFSKKMPRKMRKKALASAILAKIRGEDLMVVEGLSMDAPRTSEMATVLSNLNINRSCLLAISQRDQNMHLSCRNIADLTVRTVDELNAFDVAGKSKMMVTSEAMKALTHAEAAS